MRHPARFDGAATNLRIVPHRAYRTLHRLGRQISAAKTGRFMLILKVVPLLLPLFGILRGKRYTFQWSSMFMMIYFTEGVVRAYSDTGLSAQLALIEVALSSVFFMASIFYAKYSSPGVQEVWRAGMNK